MATTITAGNATNGAAISSDNTGILELKSGTGSGTTAMTLNASQNVGVGASLPAQKLSVIGNIALGTNNTNQSSRIQVADNLAEAADARFLFRNGTDTHAALRMVLNSANNLSLDAVQANNTSTTKDLILQTNGGNVGVGTANINGRLQSEAGTGVQNLRLSSASKSSVNIVGAREGVGYWPLDIDAFGIRLFSEGNEAARIDTSRTLLIGTTTQIRGTISNTLQIQSSTTGQIVMRHAGQTAGRYWYMGVESGNDVFFIYPDGSGGVYMTRGATSWTGNSDERLKTDLKPIENAAEKITQLRTVTGRFKTDEENVSRAFLIAQDVQTVLPEAVDAKDDELGTLGIRYTDTIPLLVAAIKELKAELDATKVEVAALKGEA